MNRVAGIILLLIGDHDVVHGLSRAVPEGP
jgi:hypothetical protein